MNRGDWEWKQSVKKTESTARVAEKILPRGGNVVVTETVVAVETAVVKNKKKRPCAAFFYS